MTPTSWGLAEQALFVHGIASGADGCFSGIQKHALHPGISCCFDGHVHTTASDGFRTPEELALEVLERDMQAVVADHDTVSGAVEAMRFTEEYKKSGVFNSSKIIPGIEFSVCVDDKRLRPLKSMHLLGVGVDVKCTSLLKCLSAKGRSRSRREDDARRLVGEMESDGFVFDSMVGGRLGLHNDFLKALVKSINIRHNIKPLRRVGVRVSGENLRRMRRKRRVRFERDVRSSIRRVYGGLVSRRFPLEDAVEVIKSAGGVVVVPHIVSSHHELQGMPVTQLRVAFSRLKNIGVDGIEVYHPAHNRLDAMRLANAAANTGLLIAGGSDAHYRTQEIGFFQGKHFN